MGTPGTAQYAAVSGSLLKTWVSVETMLPVSVEQSDACDASKFVTCTVVVFAVASYVGV